MEQNVKKKILTSVKLFAGIVLLGYILLHYFDFSIIKETPIMGGYFFIFSGLYLLVLVLSAWRWRFIIYRLYNRKLPFPRVLFLTYFGQTMALVSPSRMGDFGRSVFLRGHLSVKRTFLTLLYDKGSELIALFILAAASVVCLWEKLPMPTLPSSPLIYAMIIPPLAIISAGTFYLVKKKGGVDFIRNHIPDPATALISLAVSFFVMGATFLLTIFAALMLGIKISILEFVAVGVIQSVIVLLPITVGGIGLREGTAVIFFPPIGITEAQGILIVWIETLAMSVLPALVGAALYLTFKGSFFPKGEGGANWKSSRMS